MTHGRHSAYGGSAPGAVLGVFDPFISGRVGVGRLFSRDGFGSHRDRAGLDSGPDRSRGPAQFWFGNSLGVIAHGDECPRHVCTPRARVSRRIPYFWLAMALLCFRIPAGLVSDSAPKDDLTPGWSGAFVYDVVVHGFLPLFRL